MFDDREDYLLNMEPVKVSEDGSIRLEVLTPGEYYETEILGPGEIKLHRIAGPGAQKMSLEEAKQALEESPLRFKVGWEELRRETRE